MELQFTKTANGYHVAEFEATADFNLHVERESVGQVLMYQSTGTGGYALIDDANSLEGKTVFDYDFTALVYPKRIKVVSMSEPTYAAVTSDGEATELKVQSKSVEVTANGSVTVTPDAGFAYLDKVTVQTSVPTQGGGGAGDVEYLDVTSLTTEQKQSIFVYTGQALKAQYEDGGTMHSLIMSLAYAYASTGGDEGMIASNMDRTSAIATSKDGWVYRMPDGEMSNADFLESIGLLEIYNALPRMTKEEFYNLG